MREEIHTDEVKQLIKDILGEDGPSDMICDWLHDKGYNHEDDEDTWTAAYDELWDQINEILNKEE